MFNKSHLNVWDSRRGIPPEHCVVGALEPTPVNQQQLQVIWGAA